MPNSVLEEIGVSVFEFEKFVPIQFEAKSIKIDNFVTEQFEAVKIDITVLRRGAIGVNVMDIANQQ